MGGCESSNTELEVLEGHNPEVTILRYNSVSVIADKG